MKITDHVYALDSTKGNYAYIIIGEEIILIDTGRPGQGKAILRELELMDIKPEDIKHILITHHDQDHIGNAALLQTETGAKLWASKEDIPYIYGEKKRPGIKRVYSWFIKVKTPEKIDAYVENKKIQGIEIIKTPGHTPGHVSLLYKDILFAGDLVRSSNGQLHPMHSIMNWDGKILKESINKLEQFSFTWVCPAHGKPVKIDNQWKQLFADN